MEWYENPIWMVIGVIFTGVVIALMVGYRYKDTRFTNKGHYKEHVKNLVNSIYNEKTQNGKKIADLDFFGVIDKYRPKILEHFFTSKKQIGIDLTELFWKISKARSERDDIEKDLKKQLNEEFLKIHKNVNELIEFDYGFCSECIGKKTIIPFFNKHKLKNIKT